MVVALLCKALILEDQLIWLEGLIERVIQKWQQFIHKHQEYIATSIDLGEQQLQSKFYLIEAIRIIK